MVLVSVTRLNTRILSHRLTVRPLLDIAMITYANRQPVHVTMTGRVAWKLVSYYDNTFSAAPMLLNHTRSESTSIRRGDFNKALTNAAVNTLAARGQASDDESYEPCEAPSVLNEITLSTVVGLSKVLEEVLAGVTGVRGSSDTKTEARLYNVAPTKIFYLYQLHVVAPGIEHDFGVYSTDVAGKEKTEDIQFSVLASSVRFISKLTIHYGISQPPAERISEDTSVRSQGGQKAVGADDNINSGYPRGSFAWLVPTYTYKRSEAATSFQISEKPAYELQMSGVRVDELSKGAPPPPNQNVPFIMTICQKDSQFKIREAALLRSHDLEELSWDPQSRYDDITPNINGSYRKGAPVHLAWKLYYTGC